MAGKVDPKLLQLVQLVSLGSSLEQHGFSLEEAFNLCNEYFYYEDLFFDRRDLVYQNGFPISFWDTVLNEGCSYAERLCFTSLLFDKAI